ncbi:hypothetical protein BC939DRAFT_309684 [Gamsiella multidivaricata]|uniref:uncharacterized protein n=1 Tax=Gamsiella multidivaricata TaxID=101098 RepID=UPI0022211988|nr:uncharacterized protein BC939DRAFT_309684 [Gamsiella multidivaricata]KAI7817965.1 hypothetical protein BC939DRAFT_309684 [Gamsiella multidivaricata]
MAPPSATHQSSPTATAAVTETTSTGNNPSSSTQPSAQQQSSSSSSTSASVHPFSDRILAAEHRFTSLTQNIAHFSPLKTQLDRHNITIERLENEIKEKTALLQSCQNKLQVLSLPTHTSHSVSPALSYCHCYRNDRLKITGSICRNIFFLQNKYPFNATHTMHPPHGTLLVMNILSHATWILPLNSFFFQQEINGEAPTELTARQQHQFTCLRGSRNRGPFSAATGHQGNTRVLEWSAFGCQDLVLFACTEEYEDVLLQALFLGMKNRDNSSCIEHGRHY